VSRDLIHCNFVKTLTNLTELGPEDGGTVVIAGSHRMPLPPADLIALAEADPSLVHQIVAPAGSTLLFGNISRRRNASFWRHEFMLSCKTDQFTKTGSGQTQQEQQ
jgi:hypothetical protein